MTKTLYLLRHAKSGWDDPVARDFDRPLNKRGEKAARTIGQWMASNGVAFEQVIASPAVRVIDTLDGVWAGYGCKIEPTWERRIYLASSATLLDVLRDRLGLTGAKEGCGTGDCGACSVILDGRLVCACLVLGAELEGRRVETVEGLAEGGRLHPLQEKFLEHAALQCGICTPGLLMAAKDLLARNPDQTEAEIRLGLAGNLCRCTGYDKIVRAVEDAARVMRGA